MALSFADLNQIAGLDTDGAAGFEAQVAKRTYRLKPLPPEHLRGKRLQNFERGAAMARDWMAMRRGVGTARRTIRAAELKRTGGMPVLRACTAADLRKEQADALAQVAARHSAVDEMSRQERQVHDQP